jgi:hypothetical protein
VRLLKALKILEDATLDSKKRDIVTPEVRQALDLLDRVCQPKWRVSGFRAQLKPHAGQSGPELEGQQQVLRVYFGGIYGCVRQLLLVQITKLNYWYKKTNDSAVKAELDRLTAELEKLPEHWNSTSANLRKAKAHPQA